MSQELIQTDILNESIIVHTKFNDNLLLPTNSTALDAAFYSYGEKAQTLEKVFVNDIEKHLYIQLKKDDNLSFHFRMTKTVEYEWLKYVSTAFATSLIKKGLHQENPQDKIEQGRKILENILLEQGKGYIEEIDDDTLKNIFLVYRAKHLNDLYQKIAEGEIDPQNISNYLYSNNYKTKFSIKHIKIIGPDHSIIRFLSNLPEKIKHHISYHLKGKKNKSIINIKTKNISQKQLKLFFMIIRGHDDIQCLQIRDYAIYFKIIILFVVIAAFWGLDPVIATQLLQKTNITPYSLTLIRFLVSPVCIGAFLLLELLYMKEYQKKSLKFFQAEFIILSLSLFGIAFFGYMGLKNTIASNYVVTLILYITFFLIVYMSKYKFPKIYWKPIIFHFILTVLGFILLFSADSISWPVESKLYIIACAICFGIYSYFNDCYQRKFKVFVRSTQLHFILSIYACIFAIMLFPFAKFPYLSSNEYILAILFTSTFSVIPYLIYFYLIKQISDIITIGYAMIGVLTTVLATEIFILGIIPNFTKILSISIILISTTILFSMYHKQKKLQSRTKK